MTLESDSFQAFHLQLALAYVLRFQQKHYCLGNYFRKKIRPHSIELSSPIDSFLPAVSPPVLSAVHPAVHPAAAKTTPGYRDGHICSVAFLS